MTPKDKAVREALEYAGTLIKFCVKPEKCVTRGNIDAGTDVAKSALEIYKDIQEALTEMEKGAVDLEKLRQEVCNSACTLGRKNCHCDHCEGAGIAFDYLASRGYLRQVVSEPVENKTHKWDRDGERCVYCGDKDWMDDPVCRGTK